jgi:hypothetical protein
MAINFKSIATYSDKYRRRASVAGPDYTAGVQNPRRPWAESAIQGEGNYAAGVQNAVANKSRSAGIQKAGNAKWQEGATVKGAQRFGPGVDHGAKYYESNLAPIQQKVAATTLPPRGPKGSEANYQAPALVAKAFRAAAGKK